jgi:hypothetical protein
MRWQAVFSICLLISGLLVGCSSQGLAILTGNSPVGVTERFYTAFQKNDQDAMLDCIDPELRVGIEPYCAIGLCGIDWLRNIVEILGKNVGQQIIELTKVRCEEIDNNGIVAHVRVYCRVKLLIDMKFKEFQLPLGLVREFQLTHTLVKKGGNWYLSSPQ